MFKKAVENVEKYFAVVRTTFINVTEREAGAAAAALHLSIGYPITGDLTVSRSLN